MNSEGIHQGNALLGPVPGSLTAHDVAYGVDLHPVEISTRNFTSNFSEGMGQVTARCQMLRLVVPIAQVLLHVDRRIGAENCSVISHSSVSQWTWDCVEESHLPGRDEIHRPFSIVA